MAGCEASYTCKLKLRPAPNAEKDDNCARFTSACEAAASFSRVAYFSMKECLTDQAVELQQWARGSESNTPANPLGSPPASSNQDDLAIFQRHHLIAMASNTDAAFVDDADVDQALQSRPTVSTSNPRMRRHIPNRSGATSPIHESDNEDAPLLSPTTNDYGSASGDDSTSGRGDGEEDWPSMADFRGLPWWKRPSVSVQGHNKRRLKI